MPLGNEDEEAFLDALQGLERGDFSRLEPLFEKHDGDRSILRWHEEGRFSGQPKMLAEALTCACFLGKADVAEYLLRKGVALSGGASTGLNAFHWAVNRGHLQVVQLLIRWKAPLEARTMYGGNVLDTAVWSAMNEPRPDHLQILEELLKAGAHLEGEDFPAGNEQINAILERYGAV